MDEFTQTACARMNHPDVLFEYSVEASWGAWGDSKFILIYDEVYICRRHAAHVSRILRVVYC